MGTLLKLSIVLIAGLIGGRVARFFKLPNVTGYIIAGLLVGPSFFHVITALDSVSLGIISEFALAIIAFSIGSEFVIKETPSQRLLELFLSSLPSCISCLSSHLFSAS